jgi:SAM-dependent methyltransferase
MTFSGSPGGGRRREDGGGKGVDYERLAAVYARYREASPRILAYLVRLTDETGARRVLDIGCGTGDFTAAVSDALALRGGAVAGFDVSPGMLAQARAKHPGLDLRPGEAEQRFPYEDCQFDLAFSVNMIHYVRDLGAFFRESTRVLRPGGAVLTVTDSEQDILDRTMTRYFPETVVAESARYHPVGAIVEAMGAAGLELAPIGHTRYEGRFRPADLDRYRQRIFSALRLIPDGAFEVGLKRLEAEYAAGPPGLLEVYTYIPGRRPGGAA